MAVKYEEQNNIFTLTTKNSTYQMCVGKHGHLLHLYYGQRIEGSMEYLLTYYDRGFSGNPYEAEGVRTYSMDILPQEYPCQGTGDYRTSCLAVKNADGSHSCDLRYQSYKVRKGKYALSGLPAVYAAEEEAETLEIVLEDTVTKVQVTLLYGVVEEDDVITRSLQVRNLGNQRIMLEKVQSASLDFVSGVYDLIHFHGKHGMERMMERSHIAHGTMSLGSRRGTSSHQHNPFLMIVDSTATEDSGNCYGLSFVYSGGFKAEMEKDQLDQTRITMGIQDDLFSYALETGEEFVAPEVILSYSQEGLSELSKNYHHILRHHVCRGNYKTSPRPVLINNWEATYFDFDGDKIYQIAKQAAELGVEMLVLDDGWFGKRNSDNSGLGDWFVNEEKMGGKLSALVERINKMGLKFGLWIEPEMISEDSNLYRKHPDWALTIPGRKPIRSRDQFVLDFSREEVVDNILEQIVQVIECANIEYIKMDMNRSISDVYSAIAKNANQGEVLHRYVLGVYSFLERLITRYPNILIEGCSGGGGRFDAGMLYYTPQIWCSDNTDAIDRIHIQYGTSFGYPISAVGSHVSAVPNEQSGRITNMQTRGVVAMAGSFGYELDLNQITQEDKALVKEQIRDYHKYWNLIHNGSYYRLNNPGDNGELAAWEFVHTDGTEALINVVTLNSHCNDLVHYIKLKGLNPKKQYQIEGEKHIYSGSGLLYGGIPVPHMEREYQAWQIHLIQL